MNIISLNIFFLLNVESFILLELSYKITGFKLKISTQKIRELFWVIYQEKKNKFWKLRTFNKTSHLFTHWNIYQSINRAHSTGGDRRKPLLSKQGKVSTRTKRTEKNPVNAWRKQCKSRRNKTNKQKWSIGILLGKLFISKRKMKF